MAHPPGDGGRLGLRYFPLADALTVEEYHRLVPAAAAPLQPRPLPDPHRMLTCPHCGDLFVPHAMAGRPRFCRSVCRRRFHARLSTARRKAVA